MVDGVRRGWALVGRRERRRLRLVALYGVLIAGLDTFALVLIYALINLLTDQTPTGLAGRVMDALHLQGADRYHAALILLTVTAVLFVARSLFSVFGLWLTISATNAAQIELSGRLLVGYARAPQLLRLERNSSETLRTIMVSVDQAMSGSVFCSVSLVSNGAVAVAVALGLVLSSPAVAVAVTVYFTVIALAWARLLRGALTRRGRIAQNLQEQRVRLVMQGISAAKELQLRGRSLFYADAAVERTRGLQAVSRVIGVANGSLRYMLEAALVIGAVLVVAVAGFTSGRDAALPAVGLVLAGAFRLLPALNQILFLSNQLQFTGPAVGLVEEEVETFGPYAERPVDDDGTETLPWRFREELLLENVGFGYPTRDEPALRGVSFAIRPGESVGILGPTGSGKSTLLDIMLGMLDPDTGETRLDGAPLVERRDAWQRSIGYVPQDVYLVDETLAANVALGWYGDDIDDARVAEAISLAGLDDVVAALPDGALTLVGERGVRLSGGQRQRVGLARALYTRPSVLVLDEATSNLDRATEQRIVETLATLRGGTTMIIVTHRTATVRDCDRIVYLERGTVRALGTFDTVAGLVPALEEWSVEPKVAQIG